MEKDPKLGNGDAKIAELAHFSEVVAGQTGRLLHLLHLELIRPGAGVWFQEQPGGEDEEETIPPWPEGNEEDPLEDDFGPHADRIRVLTTEELDELRNGGEPDGVHPQPDLTKSGDLGRPLPHTPTDEWVYRHTRHRPDDGWFRIGAAPLPPCGRLWILDFYHYQPVPQCFGVNYTRQYRATLLRAFAEAYGWCRAPDANECPDARLWMLYAHWGCFQDARLGPMLNVNFKFTVACVAA